MPSAGCRAAIADLYDATESAVVAGPALVLRRLAFEPVEAAEVAAQLVHRVHEERLPGCREDRAPVLEAAVMGEDDVQQRLGALRRESRDLLNRAPDRVVPAGDLADQPALVVQAHVCGVAGVGVELPDVVQQCAAQRELTIDAREGDRGGGGRVGHLQRVLEQAGAVGVVVVLGGERATERAAAARSCAEQALHENGEVRIAQPGDVRIEPALELGDRGGRRVEKALPVNLERGEDAFHRELRSVARVLRERSDHPDRFAGRRGCSRLLDVVPHDRGHDAGAVREREAHVVRSTSRLTELALADEQHLIDGGSVPQVANVRDGGGGVGELHVPRSRHGDGFLTTALPIRTCQLWAGTRDLTLMAQQPVRVVLEKRPSGCGTWLGVMIVLGLAIEYWYVSLGVVAIVIAVALVRAARQRELARHRAGPRDPWLNEVVVALSELGLREIARNTGVELGGAAMDGDVGLQAERFLVYVNLFSDQRLARQAEVGLQAKPEVRTAVANGRTAVRTAGRVVFVANGRGGVVDEFRLDEVVRVVGKVALPPPLKAAQAHPGSGLAASAPSPDVLEQLRKLGELREAGVLTDAELEAKKAELLDRI